MAEKCFYFGMRGNMKWTKAPRQGANRSMSPYSSTSAYTNGGRKTRTSPSGSREFVMDWNVLPGEFEESLSHVLNCAAGLYPVDGDDNIYFLDPFAMRANVLPAHWSAPALAESGAPVIGGYNRNLDVVELPNAYDYPTQARRVIPWGAKLWIPVPDGYSFHFGVHGTQAGDVAVRVTGDDGFVASPTMLSVNSPTRTNLTYTPASAGGVTLSIVGASSSLANPATYISGMIAQVRPVGETVPNGGFYLGRGHSGGHFEKGVEELGLSAALGTEQYTANFIEDGAWE